jgi:hypothetical protein
MGPQQVFQGSRLKNPTVEEQNIALEKMSKLMKICMLYRVSAKKGRRVSSGYEHWVLSVPDRYEWVNTWCKHQYLLWVNKVSTAANVLPVFSKEQRDRCMLRCMAIFYQRVLLKFRSCPSSPGITAAYLCVLSKG